MTTAHYLVTVHLNIDLPLALLQPEPADAPTGPEFGQAIFYDHLYKAVRIFLQIRHKKTPASLVIWNPRDVCFSTNVRKSL